MSTTQKRAFTATGFETISGSGDISEHTLHDQVPTIVYSAPGEVVSVASRRVCFGMVPTQVLNYQSEISGSCTRPHDGHNYHFELEWIDGAAFLARSAGSLVATLNRSINDLLKEMMQKSPHTILNVYVSRVSWYKAFHASKSQRDVILPVKLNVLGEISLSTFIGDFLSVNKLYLQRPTFLQRGIEYENPHYVIFPGVVPRKLTTESRYDTVAINTDEGGEDVMEQDNEKTNLKNEFAVVFSSLVRSKFLSEITAHKRIRTTLLHHQKEALDFISQREFGPLPKQFCLWEDIPDAYHGKTCSKHIITETKSYEKPLETGGGILADDMGLGKTLSMLANIVATLQKAAEFQISSGSGGVSLKMDKSQQKSRATLVLVPSHMLIKSWVEEVAKHIYGGLRVCEYHGRGRETNISAIAAHDIVLTTYHTLAVESSKDSPLLKLHWFRVILDEAHIIRTSSTKFYESVLRLEAQFRWCVTGTPVQNNLEDLGSLVAFLKVPMLDTRLEFRQYIINPLMRKGRGDATNLRLLLDSICLRRFNKLLDLPDIDESWCEVDFTQRERERYDHAEQEFSNEIKRQANLEKSKKGLLGPFQLDMHLRRLCNHGTFENRRLPFESIANQSGIPNQEDSMVCVMCRNDLSEALLIVDKSCNVHFTTCGHLICSKCLPKLELTLDTADDLPTRKCPSCGKLLEGEHLVLDRNLALLGPQTQQPSFHLDGVSSKINALLKNIERMESRNKSIIFSYWTRTLDLVELHLRERNISYKRIDGTSSYPARGKILDEFRKDSGIRLLMMTMGTGGVGLNLAEANSVHILEPQWNPMNEAQAVARVVRLDQKKNVSIVRYIVRGTVEQTMRSQQERKLILASMGWNKDKPKTKSTEA